MCCRVIRGGEETGRGSRRGWRQSEDEGPSALCQLAPPSSPAGRRAPGEESTRGVFSGEQ